MNKTYKKQFVQQQGLENDLANCWGYNLSVTPIDTKEKRQRENSRPVVANITPRKFTKQIEKTDKIKQIQDEIKALENQRMLRELKQGNQHSKSLEEKSQIIQLMENMIDNYNEIIQHRHLTNRTSNEDNQKIIIPENKLEGDSIIEEIKQRKKELVNADLKGQIRLNKQIAKLYRQYKNTLDLQQNTSISLKHSTFASKESKSLQTIRKLKSDKIGRFEDFASISSSLNKFKFQQQPNSIQATNSNQRQFELSEQIMHKYKQAEYKKYQTDQKKNSSFSSREQKVNDHRQNLQKIQKNIKKDINQPYLLKKQVQNYKQMENKIRSNSQALDLWKNKINDACNSSRFAKSREKSSRIKKIQGKREYQQQKQRELQIEEVINNQIKIISFDDNAMTNNFIKQIKNKETRHQLQKQKIFAELLKKRNNKYNKVSGTRILVKYNSEVGARQLLKGHGAKSQARNLNSRNSSFSQNKSVINSKRMDKSQEIQAQTHRQAKNQIVAEIDWKQMQKDQEHYWRMCKNQKINLLLKRR